VAGEIRQIHASVGIIVATFGDLEEWQSLADRALASVRNQSVPVQKLVHVHSDTLSNARNVAAAKAEDCEWLIFLDADDELDENYVMYMLAGEGDIRQPSTLGVHADGHEDDFPVLIPPHNGGFLVGNNLVIGSMMRRDYFLKVGGFRDLPCLEDWDLFIRMRLEGARVRTCPNAIYRVHVNPNSRNQDVGAHGATYKEIQDRYWLDWKLKGFG
jgi:GT2 family glycosyltransferase